CWIAFSAAAFFCNTSKCRGGIFRVYFRQRGTCLACCLACCLASNSPVAHSACYLVPHTRYKGAGTAVLMRNRYGCSGGVRERGGGGGGGGGGRRGGGRAPAREGGVCRRPAGGLGILGGGGVEPRRPGGKAAPPVLWRAGTRVGLVAFEEGSEVLPEIVGF